MAAIAPIPELCVGTKKMNDEFQKLVAYFNALKPNPELARHEDLEWSAKKGEEKLQLPDKELFLEGACHVFAYCLHEKLRIGGLEHEVRMIQQPFYDGRFGQVHVYIGIENYAWDVVGRRNRTELFEEYMKDPTQIDVAIDRPWRLLEPIAQGEVSLECDDYSIWKGYCGESFLSATTDRANGFIEAKEMIQTIRCQQIAARNGRWRPRP